MTHNFFGAANNAKVAAAFGDGLNDATGRRMAIMETWVPGTAGNTTSTVEISISCRNLSDKDIMSKSDPMVVTYHKPPNAKSWVQLRRTEVIKDNLNPDFAKKVTIKYKFEQVQTLRFEVYDIDSIKARLSSQEAIGMAECTLGQIVSAGDDGLHIELTPMKTSILLDSKKSPGTIILIAEEVPSEKDEVNLKLCGHSCGSWLLCVPPKTYFAISKSNSSGVFLVVHRSKSSRGSRPNWPPLKMSSRLLCNGDMDRALKIQVFQKTCSGTLILIGENTTTLRILLQMAVNHDRIQLMRSDGGDCKAAVRVAVCTLSPVHTFLEYIQSGTQIQCTFAVDFTCSNGDPEEPESLHHVSTSASQPNPYEQAIMSVGNIVKGNAAQTCIDRRIPPRGDISHLFPITLTNTPNCESIPGVLEAYRSCISKIYLYGPTNFAPAINAAAEKAAKNQSGDNYHILVIITDGVISDMVKTKKAIVEASVYPLSIIIIGVGEADFEAMQELDGDAVRISHKGKQAQRDIVQFVAYRSARSWMSSTGENTTKDLVIVVEDEAAAAGAAGAGASSTATSMASLNDGPSSYPTTAPTTPTNTAGGGGAAPNALVAAVTEDKEEKTNRLAQSQLAQEVLFEIPDQVTSWMKARGILPANIKQRQQQQQALDKKVQDAMEGKTGDAEEEGAAEDGDKNSAALTPIPGTPRSAGSIAALRSGAPSPTPY